jgi:hypothetical protein
MTTSEYEAAFMSYSGICTKCLYVVEEFGDNRGMGICPMCSKRSVCSVSMLKIEIIEEKQTD